MIKAISPLFIIALLAVCLDVAPAHAQLSRTFVSAAIGNDANNCDRPTPCRTFQGAHNKTNTDGEITVLDAGGYGSLNITKSISIVNDGVGEASILVSGGGTGITINAGAAGYVNLRGITIQGIGFGGGTGLRLNTAFSLTMENCVVRNHTSNGIEFLPPGSSNLSLYDTLVADNGSNGIFASIGGAGTAKAFLGHVRLLNNSANGIFVSAVSGTTAVTVADSVAENNHLAGFSVSGSIGTASLMLVRSVAAHNGTGLAASHSGANLWVGQSAITGNGITVFDFDLANMLSFGDNYIAGNADANIGPPKIPRQ
jgi:hypothetical protein